MTDGARGGADTLVFEAGGRLFALPTSAVEAVIESARPYFIPCADPMVRGAVSHKGLAVAVIDASAALTGRPGASEGPLRVVVLKDKERLVGLDVTGGRLFFMWGAGEAGGAARPENAEGKAVEQVDPAAVIDEAARVLSS